MSEPKQVQNLKVENEEEVFVIHTLDKSRAEFKREMFIHMYGGCPVPTIDYRTIGREGK